MVETTTMEHRRGYGPPSQNRNTDQAHHEHHPSRSRHPLQKSYTRRTVRLIRVVRRIEGTGVPRINHIARINHISVWLVVLAL